MASEMFIPPLGTPQPSPRNPPVLPGASGGAPPAWAMTPGTPGQYPMFNSPMASTPFIPQLTPGGATPAMLPRGTPYGHSQALPNGYSADYTGYPQFGTATPQWGPSQMPPPQPQPPAWAQASPWTMPHSAPAMGGTPWGNMHASLPGGPPGMMPQSAGAWGVPPMLPQGYGPPQIPMHAMGPPQMMQPQGPPPQMMMGMGMGGPSPWDMAGMAQALPAAPLPRATGVLGDRMDLMDEFAEGPHYGPVLEPFLTHVLQVIPRINPLIRPPPLEIGDADHPFLKWNMLWASNMIQRSNDNAQTSWSDGRNSPATFPRITSMRILPNILPFTIEVHAEKPDIGVTCGDVAEAIHNSMRKHCGQSDFDCVPANRKRMVSEAYRHNRSRAYGVPGGTLGEGLRRMDFLGKETMFGGIREDPGAVMRVCGEILPCTWILDCMTRYPMTREEIATQAAREEALRLEAEERDAVRREEERERRRSRRSSRAPTVMTVTDDDDGSSVRSSVADTVRG
ncbi:hypothetical protein BDP27DRAFT_227767 [Rhodocollybia butyracea]|uniref:DUF6699 domain-containing protein n=1 Tax=Rhodocollybia butyracea TaxID=206335 RepID=A0A9P5PI29_9AGAR|nr:hypothetical protein BDP27DRAFT_227767 [Rhodocollybia butyracea]